MKILKQLANLLEQQQVNQFLVLYKKFIDAQNLALKQIGCLLATPTQVAEALWRTAIDLNDDGALTAELFKHATDPALKKYPLMYAIALKKTKLIDELVKQNSILTVAIFNDENFQRLSDSEKKVVMERVYFFQVVEAFKNWNNVFTSKSYVNKLNAAVKLWVSHSPEIVGEFIDDITSGVKPNPFTKSQWDDFINAVKELHVVNKKLFKFSELNKYQHEQQGSSASSSSNSSDNLSDQERLKIFNHAKELIDKLDAKLSLKDKQLFEDLQCYFTASEGKKLKQEERKAIINAKKFLAKNNVGEFEYFLDKPHELVGRENLTTVEAQNVILIYQEACANHLTQFNEFEFFEIDASELLPEIENLTKSTPTIAEKLEQAIKNHDVKLVESLLSFSCNEIEIDLNMPLSNHYSPMTLAAKVDDDAIIQLLLKKGLSVNAKDLDGRTGLIVAARVHTYAKCLETFLNHPQINVNVQDRWRFTALMSAVSAGTIFSSKTVFDALLAHPNVDVNLINNDHKTALMIAMATHTLIGGQQVASLLNHYDIDLTAADYYGLANTLRNAEHYKDIINFRAVWYAINRLVKITSLEGLIEKLFDSRFSELVLEENHQPHFIHLQKNLRKPERIKSVHQLILLKKDLQRGITNNQILIKKLSHPLTHDFSLLDGFFKYIIEEKGGNPFGVEQWQKLVEVLELSIAQCPVNQDLANALLIDVKAYKHRLFEDASAPKVKDILLRVPVAESSQQMNKEELKQKIALVVKQEFENSFSHVQWNEKTLNDLAVLFNPVAPASKLETEQRQPSMTRAMDFCEESPLLEYLVDPTTLAANIPKEMKAYALQLFKELVSAEIQERLRMLSPEQEERSEASSVQVAQFNELQNAPQPPAAELIDIDSLPDVPNTLIATPLASNS